MPRVRFLVIAACALAGLAATIVPGAPPAGGADSPRSEVVRAAIPETEDAGRVLVIEADSSGSTSTTDPGGIINSAVPAAAYVSSAAATYVGTFAGEALPAQPVEAADEEALGRLAQVLTAVPREGATATAAALASCLDLLDRVTALPGSICLTVTDGRPEPDGPAQLRQIEEELAPRAAAKGYRLAFLGLALNDPAGEQVFERVSELTGAPAYRSVADAARLGEVLFGLVAEWRSASTEVRRLEVPQGGRASTMIEVGNRVRRLDLIITRGGAGTDVTVVPPGGSAATTRQLTLERALVHTIEAPPPGQYLIVASGPSADSVSLSAIREGGLSASLASNPAVLPSGEPGAVRLWLSDEGARYPAVGARAEVTLASAAGEPFTADGTPSQDGSLAAGFPPLAEGSYSLEATVYLAAGGTRTVVGRADVTPFPELVIEAPNCPISGRLNHVEVRSLVSGLPAELDDATASVSLAGATSALAAEDPGLFAGEVRPPDGAPAAILSAEVSGSYRGTPTVRQAQSKPISLCPPPPPLSARLATFALGAWPAAVGAGLLIAYLAWWLTRPSPWSPLRRGWSGLITTDNGDLPIAALAHPPWTLPLRVLAPHVVPASSLARASELGRMLDDARVALWLYERWDGLGVVVGRRTGPLVVPVAAYVVADGAEVEIPHAGGLTLGYERVEAEQAAWE